MFNKHKTLKNFIMYSIQGLVMGLFVLWGSFWYLSGTPMGLFKFAFVYYTASHIYMNQPTKQQLFDGALQGMVNSLGDVHSTYLTKEAFTKLKEQTNASFVGIGVIITVQNNQPMLVTVLDDYPGAKAGLKSGDIIEKVNGKKTYGWSIQKTANSIKGTIGTKVDLTIKRGNEIKRFSITREKIIIPVVGGKMLTNKIGYIKIAQFTEGAESEFIKKYNELEKKGMTELVLDLRNNPGGLVAVATGISSYLIPKGPTVSIKDRLGSKETYMSKGEKRPKKLVVLVNGGSASASEIISGAVQDYKVGTILGTNTYGKGTVQSVITGIDKDAVKLTIAKYHTPKDRVIDGIGIKPDVIVDDNNSQGNDIQLQKAIELLQKD